MIVLIQVDEFDVFYKNNETNEFIGEINTITTFPTNKSTYHFRPNANVKLTEDMLYELHLQVQDINNNQGKIVSIKIPEPCSDCNAESCEGGKTRGTDLCHAKLFRYFWKLSRRK